MEAGWYSDPNGGSDLRWWDGSAWTEHTSAPVAEAAATSTAASTADTPAGAGDASPSGAPAPEAPPSDASPSDVPPVADTGAADAFPPPAPDTSGGFAPPDQASGGYPSPDPSSGAFPPPGPASGGFPPAGPPPQNDSSRYLLIGLVALIVVLLGVGGVVLLSGDGDDETTTESTTTTTEDVDDTTTTSADDETTTTTEPDSELVSSRSLSFARLPEPWEDWLASGRQPINELAATSGQYVVVQEQAPSGGQWIGNLLIGDLTNTIPYSGEADLSSAAHALSDTLIASYYVAGAQSSIVLEQEVTVDGHPAYFIHHELTFVQEGLETTREKVIVVIVDTGGNRPGVFWASIPYNRADLNEGMDAAYASLQVND